MKQLKRKVGRPQKPNYKPVIYVDLYDMYVQSLIAKRTLGCKLTDSEFESLVKHICRNINVKATLTVSKKQNWFKRILKRLFRLK